MADEASGGVVDTTVVGFEPAGDASESSAQTSEPSPIEIADDTLVKLPGMKEPVKYGDYYRGFQSQFTKKAKAAASLEARTAELQRQLEERDRRLSEMARPAQQNGAPSKGAELMNAIKALPYLSGDEAAKVVEYISSELGSHQEALSRRDQAILFLGKQLEQVQGLVQGMHTESSTQKFDSKVKGWMKELDLPEEAEDLVKEIYLAYEGDDLDQEFPSILRKRWEQIQKAIRGMDQRKVQAARPNPFLPKAGGRAVPGGSRKPGFKSPKEVADELFPFISGDGKG